MVITSVNNKHIKDICRLKDKKYRDNSGLYIVETFHLVLEALKYGNVIEVIISDGNDIDTDVNKIYVNDVVMKKLSSTESNPKVIAVVKKAINNNYGNKMILLDNIQDPGNLGTIIRSAVSFNFDSVVISDDCVDLYNSKVLRASEGMIFHINIIRKNLFSFISDIKKDGYLILGTDVNNGIDVRDIEVPSKYAFVIGNEGNGVSDEVRGLCDNNLYIKINNNCESLNASVAASIIMYELNSK
ncbi:MAG: RNA methyltransferase [Bacilli bacterium]|nr:RNA methyltransferase [Bacilli bacterium]